MKNQLLLSGLLAIAATAASAEPSDSRDGAATCIISPTDGAEVSGPVTAQLGLKGTGVTPVVQSVSAACQRVDVHRPGGR